MKLNAQKMEVDNTFDATEFGAEMNDPAVIQILLEKIYVDPYVWPRELLANWHDAGGGGELILPDALDPNWSIEDFGPGMTDEFMATRYAMIFASTKRDSDDDIGGFGHGRLSPLAYTDTYNVRSRFMDHESGTIMEGNYIVFRGENRIPKIARVSYGPSEVQQTGVKVVIPVGDQDLKRINARTRFFASYLPTPPSGFDAIRHDFRNETGGLRAKDQDEEMGGVRLIVGGVPYPTPSATEIDRQLPFDLFFNVNELSPTLARDAISGDDKTIKLVKARFDTFMKEYREGVVKEVEQQGSLLDSYTKYREISARFNYHYRKKIFPATFEEKFSKLPLADIFAATKDDFNLHIIMSETDRYAWEDLDTETKTARSLRGLRIKDLVSGGIAQRRAGQNYGNNDLDFTEALGSRYNHDMAIPQIVFFAVKLPYASGQIKLLKDAITAKLTELRTANTLSSKAMAVLMQYEDEADVKRFANLLSPSIEINMITDNSKRASGHQYISVIVASASKHSATRPTRLKVLQSDSSMVFIVRKPEWRANDIHNMMGDLRTLPPFQDKTLVAIQKPDADLLPKGYAVAEDTIHAWMRKNFNYPLDDTTISNHLLSAQRIANTIKNSILNANVGNTYAYNYVKKTVASVLQKREALKDDPILTAAIAAIETDRKDNYKTLVEIRNTIRTINSLIKAGFFDKKPTGGKRPLPQFDAKDAQPIADFHAKYPLLQHISHHGGVSEETIGDAINYMEAMNRNCK